MAKGKTVKKVVVTPRSRTKLRIRRNISGTTARPRVSVFRSSKHTYAQLINDADAKTILSASTLEKEVQAAISKVSVDEESKGKLSKSTKGRLAAQAVGTVLAQRALSKSIESVVFDRNGYLYHGRVQAVADGLREGGIKV